MTSRGSADYDMGQDKRYAQRGGLAWLIAVPFVLLLVGILVSVLICKPGPQTTSMQVKLEEEFSQIALLPSAQPTRHFSSGREEPALGGLVLVGSDYVTSLGFDRIRSYYDQELARNGWQPVGEEKLTDWGSNLGGREVHYRKGDFAATLTYAGERADFKEYGWTYALVLTWESKPSGDRVPQSLGIGLPPQVSFGIAALGVALWAVVQVRIISRQGLGYFRRRSFKDIYWGDLPALDRWLFWAGTACLITFVLLFL